jgi:uncharacterized protein involved in exopolysaccharide biosynthesis
MEPALAEDHDSVDTESSIEVCSSHSSLKLGDDQKHHLSIPELQREIETAFENSFRGQIVDEIRHTVLLQQLDQTKMEMYKLSCQQAESDFQQRISSQSEEYEARISALEKQFTVAEGRISQAIRQVECSLRAELAIAQGEARQLEARWAAREEELSAAHSKRLDAVHADNQRRVEALLRAEYEAATAAIRRELESTARCAQHRSRTHE